MSPGRPPRGTARWIVAILLVVVAVGAWLALRDGGDSGGRTSAPATATPGRGAQRPDAGTTTGAQRSSSAAVPRAPRVVADPDPAAPGTAYLALGDSLAQGVQRLDRRFRTTTEGYPDQLAGRLQAAGLPVVLTRLGCSGATVESLVAGGQACGPPAPVPYADAGASSSQLAWTEDWLRRRGDRPTLVTIDIGANDLLDCAVGSPDAVRSCLEERLPTALRRLRDALHRLRAAAGSRTVLAGMTYYDPAVALVRSGILRETGLAFHDVIRRDANPGILAALRSAGFLVARVDLAFGSDKPADAPGVVDATCRLTRLCSGSDFHPNAAGYGRIAGVFERVVTGPLRRVG